MAFSIVDLRPDTKELIDQAAVLLLDAFRRITSPAGHRAGTGPGSRAARGSPRRADVWAGSDDENSETTLSGTDLYPDIPGAIRDIRNLRHHPFEFYLRLGFRIAGVLPDANGRGKPDIFLAKRVGA